MADTKISALTAASSVSGTDILPIVQSATTKSATLTQVAGLAAGGGTTVKVSGSNFTTTSATLVDVTGLTFAAAANTKYEVDAVLIFQCGDSGGTSSSLAYSAAGATGDFTLIGANGTTSFASDHHLIGSSSAAYGAATSTTMSIWMRGVVVVGANTGNITIKVSKSGGVTLTIYIGSRMTVTLLA